MSIIDRFIKVSVIIPVYNTENYIKEAVNSIRQQTLRELQIIIIDDGSTDGCLSMVKEMAEEDSRIQIHSQTNQGQSVARNKGIALATGKYIYFMDSDDILKKDALEQCYQKSEAMHLDFVFFDADYICEGESRPLKINYDRCHVVDEKKVYLGINIFDQQIKDKVYNAQPCLNFIRADFLAEHQLLFYPHIIHEDELFTSVLYIQAQRVMYISRKFYIRRFRSQSTMTTEFSWKNVEGYLTVTKEILLFAKTQSAEKRRVIDHFLKRTLDATIALAYNLPLGQRLRLFRTGLLKYKRYISMRSLCVLLLKAYK